MPGVQDGDGAFVPVQLQGGARTHIPQMPGVLRESGEETLEKACERGRCQWRRSPIIKMSG